MHSTSAISRRRFSAVAAAIAATAAVTFGAAACGTETADDSGKPAAPAAPANGAPGAVVQAGPHPMSADAAEKWAELDRIEQLRRHYSVGIKDQNTQERYRRQSKEAPGHWRELGVY